MPATAFRPHALRQTNGGWQGELAAGVRQMSQLGGDLTVSQLCDC